MIVSGEEYPAPDFNQNMASLVSYLQMAVMIMAFFGETICEKFQITLPEQVKSILEKKMMLCIGSFLLSNMIRSNLLSTGAFEIYFDEELVFSKLQTGQAPDQFVVESLLSEYKIV
jgi:selT/selW/selH-like putative selenoprotein